MSCLVVAWKQPSKPINHRNVCGGISEYVWRGISQSIINPTKFVFGLNKVREVKIFPKVLQVYSLKFPLLKDTRCLNVADLTGNERKPLNVQNERHQIEHVESLTG